ncbi:hypothetical protein B296_00023841 [Ensete ventricosum]|uniref:UBA domain-containing protein n=1 Tax=Ensete ventricosum TaxID=4639 RepID=A0A426Z3V6_ENSVE|nr:hypothetical protein B296_00023841 [Ensete ventricosum]
MSPASKSKSKDKLPTKAAKEQAKVTLKTSAAPLNYGNGAPSSAYSPDLGTFHAFDTTSCGSLTTGQHNGCFRIIDETEEHSCSSFGSAGDSDSLSNHNSYSGESEDQKEKITTSNATRREPVTGCDTDKREKIRQKNERKHQRQKERRAQELHERCSGYLMSRKLEMLAQKLVAMGFSSEQATMALIQNEGHVEESIGWLLEGGEESKQQTAANVDGGVSLKIDIIMELAKISDLEVKFKCTKQEVERAVVATEGDLEKAEETLKAHKQEPKALPSKSEESNDPAIASGLNNKTVTALRPKQKEVASFRTKQQRRGERDLNHIKAMPAGAVESSNKNLQSLRKIQPKVDLGKPQVAAPVEKRWPSTTSAPSISSSSPSLQVSAAPLTNQYAMASSEAKAIMPGGTLREPVIVMQRPQSVTAKQNPSSTNLSSASPPSSTGWYSNGISSMEAMKVASKGHGQNLPNVGLNGSSAQQFAPRNHIQSSATSAAESFATGGGGSSNNTGISPASLAVPSSLGLFTGWGLSGSSVPSPLDWSLGGYVPCDYTTIDWSLDMTLLRPSLKSNRLSSTWSTMFMGGKVSRPTVSAASSAYISGLQDCSGLVMDSSYPSGSHEWSSPFAGKDLFSVPRQFVTNYTPSRK